MNEVAHRFTLVVENKVIGDQFFLPELKRTLLAYVQGIDDGRYGHPSEEVISVGNGTVLSVKAVRIYEEETRDAGLLYVRLSDGSLVLSAE